MGHAVATRSRWAVLAFLVAAVVVVGGAAVIIANLSEPAVTGRSADDRLESSSTGTGDDGRSTSPATLASNGTLDVTGESKPLARPKVSDIPAPPASAPPAAGQPVPSAWEQYIAETREIVHANQPDLAAITAQITRALSDGDEATLAALLAPDERPQDAYIADLADTYPTILTSTTGSNVNVFTSGSATVYIAYAVVSWTDGGLVSTHTIPIMLRFVDGQWHLTTLGDTGSDLQFVQSIQL